MKIVLEIIPEEIVQQYNLHDVASNVWVYMEIRKGMPGPKNSGRITNDRLQIHLAKFGYAPVARTPYLWKHATKDINFSLVVNYLGVKQVRKGNSDYLIQALKKLYTISINWTGAF